MKKKVYILVVTLLITMVYSTVGTMNNSKTNIDSITTNNIQYEVEIYPSHDTFIYEREPNRCYGQTQSEYWFELWVASLSGWDARILLKFPIKNSVPSNAIIDSARLELFMTYAPQTSRTYDVHRLLDDWAEEWVGELAGATWNNQPRHEPTITDSTTSGISTEVIKRWTVTSDVQSILNNEYPEFGWMIKDHQEDVTQWDLQARFVSKDNNLINWPNCYEYWPKLIITYSYPQGTEPPTVDITSPTTGTIVTNPNIHLIGVATDDLYIDGFTWDVKWSGGTDIGPWLFIGNPNYNFDWELDLHPGGNIITVRVDDSDGNVAFSSTTVSYTNEPNQPIKPSGEVQGNAGEAYVYTSSATDPDGDQVEYLFDWIPKRLDYCDYYFSQW